MDVGIDQDRTNGIIGNIDGMVDIVGMDVDVELQKIAYIGMVL